ncbi:MAG: inorganic phosphate transporter [Bacillota bacterium]|nr:inorganic phosphate transporter [Bacillota bacterium]
MLSPIIFLIIVLLVALTFTFINGFHDTANSIATTVSTRVLSPKAAIAMAAILNFVGAYVSTTFFGSGSVAGTISKGLVSGTVEQHVITSALVAAIIWGLFTWKRGLPSSSSHALIGGLLGAAIVDAMSTNSIQWNGVLDKVIIPLIASPIIGLLAGFLVMNLLFEILRGLSQYMVNRWFSKLQIVSSAFMAFSHGSNDAQKTMGIITMSLLTLNATHPGELPQWMLPSASHAIPFWVIILCAVVMALGTSLGGWRIIKTMGVNMIKLNPIGGFAAETSAAIVIETASLLGAPVSTTHVISAAIMGVGSAKRLSAVRWSVARNIVISWVFTIPVAVILGGIVDLAMKPLFSLF